MNQKYTNDLKKVGNNAINELEPVLKNGVSSIIDIVKDIAVDTISAIFENRKNKNNKVNGDKNNG